MNKKNRNEVEFKKPSLQRKLVAWMLIFALAGSALISAVALLVN